VLRRCASPCVADKVGKLGVDVIPALTRSRTSREFVKAVSFLLDADETRVCSAGMGELVNELVGGMPEVVDLAGSK